MTSSLHSMLGGFAGANAVDAPASPSGSSSSVSTALNTSGVRGGHGIVGLDALSGRGTQGGFTAPVGAKTPAPVKLSDEQRAVIDAALAGRDVIVEAVPGSGKTMTIQHLCNELNAARPDEKILYLTYSRLLKDDARQRVTGAKVQNYHGIVYPGLLAAGIRCGVGESIAQFNANFDSKISASFETYDVIVVDEYQDITEEYARLLENIKSKNPVMQVIMVGDMEQKVSAASRHDAQAFARRFCDDPVLLPFTRSFRLGSAMAAKLGAAWNKPIVGANTSQTVELMDFNQAVAEMLAMKDRPGDILCLGKRNGQMTDALNLIESKAPKSFNKNTVFASVKDKGAQVSFTPNSAIFTTFDSSKGLERDTCFVFDYTVANLKTRLSFDTTDPAVMRNIFLVAASRGKSRIIFVSTNKSKIYHLDESSIGGIPVEKFRSIGEASTPVYTHDKPFNVEAMFDFKYVETVDEAFDLLDRRLVNEASSEPLAIQHSDGLIDLMSVINQYQKNMFFDAYDTKKALAAYGDYENTALKANMSTMLNKATLANRLTTAWDDALALTASMTNYDRYVKQVTVRVSPESTEILRSRLSELVDPGDRVQMLVEMFGVAKHNRSVVSDIAFAGVCDVVRDDSIIQLHFAPELDHAMFLQAAMLAVMAGKEKAVVWNTRTNERWEVRVPDEQRFLDAVVYCVTKQSYKTFKEEE